jgi:DMSO/TMAO reductase YedYZ molybdopterin-dependent catalytic subunit
VGGDLERKRAGQPSLDPAPAGTGARRWRLALSGALTGVAGLAASELATDLLQARATPVQVVAESVIEVTPGWVAEPLISLVGRYDKPLLVAGVTLSIPALGALAGLLTARRAVLGQLVFWVMGVLALAATATRHGFTPYALLPLAAGVVVWTLLLDHLTGVARRGPTPQASRRRFLVDAGAVAVAAVAMAGAGRLVSRSRRSVETTRRLLRLPVTAGVVPTGAQRGSSGSPWRSPNADFYRIDTAIVVPVVDPNEWTLRIHGMVDREITVTYRELVARELTEAWVTLCCVSNEVGGDLVDNAWWSGVRVADLLREAGVQAGADAVKQTSEDGWTCGTPLAALTDDRNALLAVAMNGRPLPIEHGFPVRMVVPGLYGFVSATKWVVDLEVTAYDRFSAYWTERGWSEKGPVKTQSRVEVPRDGGEVRSGRVRVGGHAWAQHTGVEMVEFRLDGEPWRTAELGRVPNADTWVQWSGVVDVAPGEHSLAVRATDRSGHTQTAARSEVLPDGATGWHTVSFTAG